MILCDAGPLIALINENDEDYLQCKAIAAQVSSPLVTTWPCLAEAMHVLGHRIGPDAQAKLWDLVNSPFVLVAIHESGDIETMRTLMLQYRNVPMDLGDASLICVAQNIGLLRIFTLDSDFQIYRTNEGHAFELVP